MKRDGAWKALEAAYIAKQHVSAELAAQQRGMTQADGTNEGITAITLLTCAFELREIAEQLKYFNDNCVVPTDSKRSGRLSVES